MAVHRVANRRGMQALSGVEVPQGFARGGVRRFKEALIVGEKYQAARRRHNAAPTMRIAGLRIAPHKLSRLRIESEKHLRALRIWIALGSGGVILLAFDKCGRLAEIDGATLQR